MTAAPNTAEDTSGHEAFRSELRDWLESNVPDSLKGMGNDVLEGCWGGRRPHFPHPDQERWLELAAGRGLTAPTWPKAYGGAELSPAQNKIFREELTRLDLPAPLIGFGLTMIGPTLLRFGTEAQKAEHLPKIVAGKIRWCQGYSEPGAGSDLASLQTRAIDDGDHYILNGTKVWTSYADKSDWIFALVRTDPDAKKQEGITFLLIDMETPGVSVSPILLISGASPFCETYFRDVRVPKANVVSKENNGWTVAKALLQHERTMIADAFGSAGGAAKSATLADLARRYAAPGRGAGVDPVLRDQIAQNEMDTASFKYTVQRARDAARAGHQPGPESSMFKLYGTELNQRRYDLLMRIAGPQALGWEGEGFDAEELSRTREWLRSRGNTIEGGTSEVQRNIIAKRVLALPD
ncbi:MAG: acyl-CoA dehydrogenase [Myxococcales bacterium]|nr:acyl-CoA dehydrogenase [Myxococcales bacterium]